MSSITIEVEDPDEAYENVQAMLDAAPVDFSRVSSVRLEIEYDAAAETEDTSAEAAPAIDVADDAGDDEDGFDESADATGDDSDTAAKAPVTDAVESPPVKSPPVESPTPSPTDDVDETQDDAVESPSIADAEGGTVSGDDEAFESTDDESDETLDLEDAAAEISFGAESTDDTSTAGDDADDDDDTIFDAESTAGTDTRTGDSIFAASGTTTEQRETEPVDETDGLDGVTFEESTDTSTTTSPDPTDTESADTDQTRAETRTPNTPAGAEANRESEAAEQSDAASAPMPSPRTYNKVMRLLQNRDFPIERAEIEEVAVGAYDVDPDECRAIVDAAIEKGLVAQDGPKLVDPSG
ncbi:hypothetical protein [Haloarchaeobius sp. DFWS5]|uniref:hypothetical protein n=1 Tax=Haloarchaeobius sp. DFWS5 TaxID=3446114 RepID=UPI003EBDDE62